MPSFPALPGLYPDLPPSPLAFISPKLRGCYQDWDKAGAALGLSQGWGGQGSSTGSRACRAAEQSAGYTLASFCLR